MKNTERLNRIDIDISTKHIDKFKAILAGDFNINESISFEEISFEEVNQICVQKYILKNRAERNPQSELK